MAHEDILCETRDGVAWITINRPELRNAFRAKTVDELIAAFRAAWGDPEVGVVVLTGAGDKAFSAGGDQRERTGGGYTGGTGLGMDIDRKSTRLNSSHSSISYAVFCLK